MVFVAVIVVVTVIFGLAVLVFGLVFVVVIFFALDRRGGLTTGASCLDNLKAQITGLNQLVGTAGTVGCIFGVFGVLGVLGIFSVLVFFVLFILVFLFIFGIIGIAGKYRS